MFLSPPLKGLGFNAEVIVVDGSNLAYVELGSLRKLYVENGLGDIPPVPSLKK